MLVDCREFSLAQVLADSYTLQHSHKVTETHLLPVLGNHGIGLVAVGPFLEFELGHRVEELGEVLGHLERLVAVRQDVEQVV